MMEKGYLALVLNAHLPFAHPEEDGAVQQNRLFRAVTQSYLPLLDVLEGLSRDGVPYRMTISLSPTLLAMLGHPLFQEGYMRHLEQLIGLAEAEMERSGGNARQRVRAEHERKRFGRWKEKLAGEYRMNIVRGWKKLALEGGLELITTSATHAFLPYIKTKQALRAQIENAMLAHAEHFGSAPKGIWLPECGYSAELDRVLYEYGIRYFFTDSHGVLGAEPAPRDGLHAPYFTPNGLAVFGRDPETARHIRGVREGAPGFGRAAYAYGGWLRGNLDIASDRAVKFYRMLGDDAHKDSDEPTRARKEAAGLAAQFLYDRKNRIEELAARMERKPIILASYDAELFGQWWYEGPVWIDLVCRGLHRDQQSVGMVTPSDYLAAYPAGETGLIPTSSRGPGGFGDAWLSEANEWMYRYLHRMEEAMIGLADAFPGADGRQKRALNQALRELMLAQSSDWAFMLDSGGSADYAGGRFGKHAARFEHIRRGLLEGELDPVMLADAERLDSVFPLADYRTFRSAALQDAETLAANRPAGQDQKRLRVLMLSWEYPPRIVGGLSRHVHGLSRELVCLGAEVHVVTCQTEGCPTDEVSEGVYVHRVNTYQSEAELSFFEWVMQLNAAMLDKCRMLKTSGIHFDLIHAHDWLAAEAGKALQRELELPLVATIHATEHGRNGGIHNDLQARIHRQEEELIRAADRVIVCSRFMESELRSLFRLAPERIDVIPNGIAKETVVSGHYSAAFREQFAMPHERIVLFVGRLVPEKGVHILIDSMPSVLAACPATKLVIAGRGPMLEELKARTFELGIQDRVHFSGFLEDQARNQLLGLASAAVFPSLYEPFGIAPLEAMAAGVPVVVSGTGGLTEIVQHGVDGLTVLPGNVHSLARQLIRILQNERKAHEMARIACRKASVEFSWEQAADKTLRCYAKAANKYSEIPIEMAGEKAENISIIQ